MDLWQHVVVTLAAMVAAGVLVRQVMAFISPPRRRPGQAGDDAAACANCPTGAVKRKKNASVAAADRAPVIQIQRARKL